MTEGFDVSYFLRQHNIGDASPNVPEDQGRLRLGNPQESILTVVPDMEPEILPPPVTIQEVPLELLAEELVRFEASLLRVPVDYADEEVQTHRGIGGIFQSIDDFIFFKRKLSTYFSKKSSSMGYPVPITTCAEPHCINPTVPTFSRCINHIVYDERFTLQYMLEKCKGVPEAPNCDIPTSLRTGLCQHHRR